MKRVALINDLSGLGKCSLTASIPVISVMGLQACPLPTAVLSSQTGFDSYFYDDYTNRMNNITDEWIKQKIEFAGILSGYLGSPSQIENVQYFLDAFRKEDTLFLVDPILGDNGNTYKIFSGDLLSSMMRLTKIANIITPNLTELCLLAGEDYHKLNEKSKDNDFISRIEEIANKVRSKADVPQTVITTGIIHEKDGIRYVENLAISDTEKYYRENKYTGASFSGTGDLFASVVLGDLVRGNDAAHAVNLAMDFLQPAIEEATEENIDRNHGINFEKYLGKLI